MCAQNCNSDSSSLSLPLFQVEEFDINSFNCVKNIILSLLIACLVLVSFILAVDGRFNFFPETKINKWNKSIQKSQRRNSVLTGMKNLHNDFKSISTNDIEKILPGKVTEKEGVKNPDKEKEGRRRSDFFTKSNQPRMTKTKVVRLPDQDILMQRKSMKNFGFLNCPELLAYHEQHVQNNMHIFGPNRCASLKRKMTEMGKHDIPKIVCGSGQCDCSSVELLNSPYHKQKSSFVSTSTPYYSTRSTADDMEYISKPVRISTIYESDSKKSVDLE